MCMGKLNVGRNQVNNEVESRTFRRTLLRVLETGSRDMTSLLAALQVYWTALSASLAALQRIMEVLSLNQMTQ